MFPPLRVVMLSVRFAGEIILGEYVMTSLKKAFFLSVAFCAIGALAACDNSGAGKKTAEKEAAPAGPHLGIRPYGDETVKIDMSKVQNADLKKIYGYIDKNIDQHVNNLQKWIQQPSISNTGEGIQESAEMVKGFFDQLGCTGNTIKARDQLTGSDHT